MSKHPDDIYKGLIELTEVRVAIIRKEAEIESIRERIAELEASAAFSSTRDDLHKAKLKLKFEKERMVELRCKHAELEVSVIVKPRVADV